MARRCQWWSSIGRILESSYAVFQRLEGFGGCSDGGRSHGAARDRLRMATEMGRGGSGERREVKGEEGKIRLRALSDKIVEIYIDEICVI